MAGAQAAVGPTSGYTGTIGNQTFKNGVLQPDSATAGGANNYEQQTEPYKQQFRPDVQPGQRNVGSYGNYGLTGGNGFANAGEANQNTPGTQAADRQQRNVSGYGNYGQYRSQQGGYGYGQQRQPSGYGSQSGQSRPYGGWAQPQRMGYGNYGQQQNSSQQPIQRRTPEGPGNSTSSF